MISEPATIRRLFADVKYVLFDFDGPICDIFAGLPAPTIAATLRTYLAPLNLPLPPHILTQQDPLEILRYAATAGPLIAETTEAALRGLELQAALTATPTSHTANIIKQLHTTGRQLLYRDLPGRPVARVFPKGRCGPPFALYGRIPDLDSFRPAP